MIEGRCVHHPSRETALRCRECATYVCERCRRDLRGQVYCRPKCIARGAVRDAVRSSVDLLRGPVEPLRAGAALGLAGLALTATTLVLAAILIAERAPVTEAPPAPATPTATHALEATLHEGAGTWRLVVTGPPASRVLVIADGRPLAVLTLDGDGTAEIAGSGRLGDDVAAAALGGEPIAPLRPAAARGRAASTPPPSPTRTLTRTPTATPTASPTPTATASPSPPPTPVPTVAAVPTLPRRDRISPSSPVGPPVLHLVTDAGPLIAITFDGGASSNGSAQLLDLLRELDLHATLFLTGEFIAREPELLRRALLDGHEVGNHTWSHPRLTTYAEDRRHRLRPEVTREWFQDQLRRTESAFRAATGRPLAPLWRAPYGEENTTLRAWAAELGYLHVRWSSLEGSSLDSWDWVADEHSPLFENADEMVDRLLRFPRLGGGIVLMHLASQRTEPPWRALPRLVETLRTRKITPVRVTELLERSPAWRARLDSVRRRHRELNPD